MSNPFAVLATSVADVSATESSDVSRVQEVADEVDVDWLKFIQPEKAGIARVTQPFPELAATPSHSCLLAVSNVWGLVFVGSRQNILIHTLSNVSKTPAGSKALPARTLAFDRTPIWIRLAMGDLRLVVGLSEGGGVAIFDVKAVMADHQVPPLHTFADITEPLLDLLPNPSLVGALPHLVLAVGRAKTRILSIGGETGFKVLHTLKEETRCAAWSAKGKQFVAGLQNGTLVQYAPDGTRKAVIPLPSAIDHNNHFPTAVFWLENDVFLVTYNQLTADDDREPIQEHKQYLVARDAKAQPPTFTYTLFEDVLPNFGMIDRSADRRHLAHLRNVAPNAKHLAIMSSGSASDLAILAADSDSQGASQWKILRLEETVRPTVPLTEDYGETTCLGIDFDLRSETLVKQAMEGGVARPDLPPQPRLIEYTSDGVLVIYDMIAQGGGAFAGMVRSQDIAQSSEPSASTPAAVSKGAPAATTSPMTANSFTAKPSEKPTLGFGSVKLPTLGGGFGKTATPAFGASAFGSPSPSGPAMPAFGASAFGQPAFGTPSAFGAKSPQTAAAIASATTPSTPGATSAFGSPASATPAFGASSFGASKPSPFGASAFGTRSVFGGSNESSSPNPAFGASAFGKPSAFAATAANGNRAPASAFGGPTFGKPSASGTPAGSSSSASPAFGTSTFHKPSAFGQSPNPAATQVPAPKAFGLSSGANPFAASSSTSKATSPFGFSAFGKPAGSGFGASATSQGSSFGSGAAAPSAKDGTATHSVFGSAPATETDKPASGFAFAPNAPGSGLFGFAAKSTHDPVVPQSSGQSGAGGIAPHNGDTPASMDTFGLQGLGDLLGDAGTTQPGKANDSSAVPDNSNGTAYMITPQVGALPSTDKPKPAGVSPSGDTNLAAAVNDPPKEPAPLFGGFSGFGKPSLPTEAGPRVSTSEASQASDATSRSPPLLDDRTTETQVQGASQVPGEAPGRGGASLESDEIATSDDGAERDGSDDDYYSEVDAEEAQGSGSDAAESVPDDDDFSEDGYNVDDTPAVDGLSSGSADGDNPTEENPRPALDASGTATSPFQRKSIEGESHDAAVTKPVAKPSPVGDESVSGAATQTLDLKVPSPDTPSAESVRAASETKPATPSLSSGSPVAEPSKATSPATGWGKQFSGFGFRGPSTLPAKSSPLAERPALFGNGTLAQAGTRIAVGSTTAVSSAAGQSAPPSIDKAQTCTPVKVQVPLSGEPAAKTGRPEIGVRDVATPSRAAREAAPSPSMGMAKRSSLADQYYAVYQAMQDDLRSMDRTYDSINDYHGQAKPNLHPIPALEDLEFAEFWSFAALDLFANYTGRVAEDVSQIRDASITLNDEVKKIFALVPKANTKSEDCARYVRASRDRDFAKRLRARQLGPEQSDNQASLRLKTKITLDRLDKLEGQLLANKKRISQQRTGRIPVRAPALDSMNRTIINVSEQLQHDQEELEILSKRLRTVSLTAGQATKDDSDKAPYFLGGSAHVQEMVEAVVKMDDSGRRLRSNALTTNAKPAVSRPRSKPLVVVGPAKTTEAPVGKVEPGLRPGLFGLTGSTAGLKSISHKMPSAKRPQQSGFGRH